MDGENRQTTTAPREPTLLQKLEILAASARYDASCVSSGSSRRAKKGGLGNAAASGICHSWASDGRCISLLKVLFTNHCIYDCAYCLNRRSNPTARAMFTPEELAELTIGFYRRNYIEGLFLSSGVFRSPDTTMEMLLRTVRLLREVHQFQGYIHLKAIPGADPLLLFQAGQLVDRLSVNVELPSEKSLEALAPEKHKESIFGPMRHIRDWHLDAKKTRSRIRGRSYVPAGQSTQMIVGASPESDQQILSLSSGLYKTMGLRRVFYSAYVPVNHDRRLPELAVPPLLREHRLYQADWLMRFYQFGVEELFAHGTGNLDADVDPKVMWALHHLDIFPLDVNRADYEFLLRVPGLGVRSAQRIVRARKTGRLTLDDLPRLGVVWKRARFFLSDGVLNPIALLDAERLRRELVKPTVAAHRQLTFADLPMAMEPAMVENLQAAVTGEF